jgi:hypothetical protein
MTLTTITLTMNYISKILSTFVLSLFVLSSCADKASMPGKAFEGRIVQKLTFNASAFAELADSGSTGSSGQGVESMMSGLALKADVVMYMKADKLAYEISMLGGLFSFRSIIDPMTRKLTILSPMEKKAYVADLKEFDKNREEINDSLEASSILDSLATLAPQSTGKKEEINGFDCEQYTAQIQREGKTVNMEMWITTDPRLKFYDVMRDAILGKKQSGSGGLEQLMAAFQPFAGKGKVPVRMSMKINGKPLMTSEMTEMVEEKLDNKYFEVPQGFQIIDKDATSQKRDSI